MVVMEMRYIPLVDMVDYVDATRIMYPITMEICGLDDSYGDNPCQLFGFTSIEDFNEELAEMAGFLGSNGMRALTARIV